MLPLLKLQPENLALLKTLGANAFWLGQLKYDVSDWAASRPFYEQYLKYSQTMYALAPEDKDALMELSYAHNTLGSVSMKQQDFAKAQQDFEESLRLKLLALAKAPEDSQLIADVANARSWLASAAVSQGDVLSAIQIHIQLQQELGKNIKQPYILDRLSASHQILADLYGYQNQPEQALEQTKLGLEAISTALEKDPKNEIWIKQKYYQKFNILALSHADIDEVKNLKSLLYSDDELNSSSKKDEIYASFFLAAAKNLQQQDKPTESYEFAIQAKKNFLNYLKSIIKTPLIYQNYQKASY